MQYSQPVIAVFDIGKTNKKIFLFDELYRVVYEHTAWLEETTDEDGDPCEDIAALRQWLNASFGEAAAKKEFQIKAVNFSAYGASFVYIGEDGEPVAPLYNYLKEYPPKLKEQFYNTYGGEEFFSKCTASPVLGSLNSGMQLYRMKYGKQETFHKIKYALHLPQYLSYTISRQLYSDITSIGCHTNLWDFTKNDYHEWVMREQLSAKLAPIISSGHVSVVNNNLSVFNTGIGLHDSSAALIPYLVSFREPFVLLSTGTWSISLNPFNHEPLTFAELKQDCLCYLQYNGKPVKASRLFAGKEHEEQLKRIVAHFGKDAAYYSALAFDPETAGSQQKNKPMQDRISGSPQQSVFSRRDMSVFSSGEEAYHQLVSDIVAEQYISTRLVIGNTGVKRIFVDGGFGKNAIYMNLLAAAFPGLEVYTATVPQATALGAALAIHSSWNDQPLAGEMIEVKHYPAVSSVLNR